MDGPKIFKDANGQEIKAGDTLFRKFYARRREHPGRRRVAINGMSGNESIVNDEGALLEREAHWITRRVEWHGACMTAERAEYSDFQVLCSCFLFDENDVDISEGSTSIYMNNVFDSTVYTINNEL